MKITFMVGNGFDMGLGIKSSYGAFYNWYCKMPSEKAYIQMFKKDIMNDMSRDIPADEKTWADFELGLGAYTANFTKASVDRFIECYGDAQESIAKYLKEQEASFDPETYSEESYTSFLKSIFNFYEETPDGEKNRIKGSLDNVMEEDREVTVVSFNYTDSLERIWRKIPDEPLAAWTVGSRKYTYRINRNIIHVHGTTTAFPILGVNDDSQIANKELLDTPQFKEMLIKADCVNALGQLWHDHAKAQIENSRFICILGMSLGASDTKWWKLIAQWLTSSDKRHVIVYWYEKNPPNGVSIYRQIRCINNVKDKLLSYSSLSDAIKGQIRDRIHVVINTDTFLQLKKATTACPNSQTVENITAAVK